MRRNSSLLALGFLLASALPSGAAQAQPVPGVQLIGLPLCTELLETGQVQCSGAVTGVDRGGAPARAQISMTYRCETGGLRTPPAVATGQSELSGGEGNLQIFQVATPPVSCATNQPPALGSQVSLRIYQGDQIVLQQNLRVYVIPPPGQ